MNKHATNKHATNKHAMNKHATNKHATNKHGVTATRLSALLPLLLGACAMAPPTTGGASIAGAIRVGNQAGPAMRVCAMPVDGGASRCTQVAAGAAGYRIEALPAGRYHVVGWVKGGELRMIAHASTIRCIRAPCPPDELIAVDLADGAAVANIDLQAPYTEVPAGWPQEPAR